MMMHREPVVVPTLPATAPTLHGSAAARNARRRPHTPDAADSDPAKRLERQREGGQPRRRVVGRPHRRGPSDTSPPAPPGAHQPGRCKTRTRTPRFTLPTTKTTTTRHRAACPPLATCRTVGARSAPRTKTTTATSSSPSPTRLRIAFGWLVGDAEWAMGIARGAHGAEWGDFFHRGGAMTPGATKRLMAAYPTWRGIPPPRSLESLIQRTLQPHIPPTRLGTYGIAAVARMMARGTRLDGSSYSPRRNTATITTPLPRSRATTATRATDVRARTSAATSSTSPNPSTSAPPTPAAEPHQQNAADAMRTTGDPAPCRASTVQSPRQERASKRAAQ